MYDTVRHKPKQTRQRLELTQTDGRDFAVRACDAMPVIRNTARIRSEIIKVPIRVVGPAIGAKGVPRVGAFFQQLGRDDGCQDEDGAVSYM